MDLSIIIVNWNTRGMLAGCLESVFGPSGLGIEQESEKYMGQQALTAEVIVVDNASSDGSAEMVAKHFPQVHLLRNQENLGFAAGNNQAIRQSTGRYLLLLNSDTELYPGALQGLVSFMDENPKAGGCGPLLLNDDDSLQPSCHPMLTPEREFWRLMFLDRLWRRATYNQESWPKSAPRPVEVIKGACFLLRKAALDQVGLLDDGYFMYTEEMDLCYRLLEAGWHLWWAPQAVVKHYGEASSKQMAETMYVQLYRSKVQFHRKFGGSRRANWFKSLLRLAYWSRLIISSLSAPFSSAPDTQRRTFRRLLAELPEM